MEYDIRFEYDPTDEYMSESAWKKLIKSQDSSTYYEDDEYEDEWDISKERDEHME